MNARFAVATLCAFFAAGTIAFADTPQQGTQTSRITTVCSAATDPPVPLAVYLTPQGVFPAVPQQFGASMRGACVGTPDYAPSTQPFTSAYPYPGAWWVFGVYPPQPYRGT